LHLGSAGPESDVIQGQVIAAAAGCIIGHAQHYIGDAGRGGKDKAILRPGKGARAGYIPGVESCQRRTSGRGLDAKRDIWLYARAAAGAGYKHIGDPCGKLVSGIGTKTFHCVEIEITWLIGGVYQHEISTGVARVVGVDTVPGAEKASQGAVGHCIKSIAGAVGIIILVSGGSCPQARAGVAPGAESDVHYGVAEAGALLRSTEGDNA